MIFMTAFLTGDMWTVAVGVRGMGSFAVIKAIRKEAWREAWEQVIRMLPDMPAAGHA